MRWRERTHLKKRKKKKKMEQKIPHLSIKITLTPSFFAKASILYSKRRDAPMPPQNRIVSRPFLSSSSSSNPDVVAKDTRSFWCAEVGPMVMDRWKHFWLAKVIASSLADVVVDIFGICASCVIYAVSPVPSYNQQGRLQEKKLYWCVKRNNSRRKAKGK